MRRLPIYFLIDVSESTVGEPIRHIEEGMRTVVNELHKDPYALETAWVSVIAFAGKAQTLVPLTEVYAFTAPDMPVGGGTSLGRALTYLMNELDTNVQRSTAEVKGDWKPLIFLFTDGMPTDNPDAAIKAWNQRWHGKANLVAVVAGDNVDTSLLGRLTDIVLRLNNTTGAGYREFFKWISSTVRSVSMAASEGRRGEATLPRVDGINLEKVDPTKPCKVDENFAVFHARCATTKRDYLIKYERLPISPEAFLGEEPDFMLTGAYPIDGKVYESLSERGQTNRVLNTGSLIGAPSCPCCENQVGLVLCGSCGHIFCAKPSGICHCPWCGFSSELTTCGEEGLNLTRTRG